MSDFLMRDDAPFDAQEWARLDALIVDTASKLLVGRRFISLTGPLGIGVQAIPVHKISGGAACLHDEQGCDCQDCECDEFQVTQRAFLQPLLIHKDFRLNWRDIQAAQAMGLPLDFGPAAAAGAACAHAEDKLIFHGHPDCGYEGLLNAQGRNTIALESWDKPHKAFENIVAASEKLVSAGFYGPFAVVLSPALYAQTQRVITGAGRLEKQLIQDIAAGGLFRSPTLNGQQGLVVSQGPHNLDLVIAQDLITACLGPDNMDHTFRVLESLALRIKRAGAICTLEAK